MAKKKKPVKLTKAKIKKMARTAKRKQLIQWSKDVRERDGNKCIVCGKTEYLNAHHLIPKKRFPQYMLEINCGITLCPYCHQFGPFAAETNGIFSAEFLKKYRIEQWNWVIEKLNIELSKHPLYSHLNL